MTFSIDKNNNITTSLSGLIYLIELGLLLDGAEIKLEESKNVIQTFIYYENEDDDTFTFEIPSTVGQFDCLAFNNLPILAEYHIHHEGLHDETTTALTNLVENAHDSFYNDLEHYNEEDDDMEELDEDEIYQLLDFFDEIIEELSNELDEEEFINQLFETDLMKDFKYIPETYTLDECSTIEEILKEIKVILK